MDMILLALAPVVLLLMACGFLAVTQIGGLLQFGRFRMRENRNGRLLSRFMVEMALAQNQVTSRSRQLEELSRRLRMSNEELERLNTLKTKFLSMVVHDVRNPLSSITGYSQILKTQPLDSRQQLMVSSIKTAADQINSLLGDLTDLAVIEAGKLRIVRQPLELKSFMSEAVGVMHFVAESKGVRLSLGEVPDGVTLYADGPRLARVLQNLLGNAIKFTPAGGLVEATARLAGGRCRIAIKDSGPGVHPSERRRIFEKFYQSRFATDAARAKGWGLGLAICDEIVRGHDGQIGVDSAGLGKGSTFWFELPLAVPRQRRLALRGAAAALLALGLSGTAGAQGFPLDEKARFEQALEAKAEKILLRVLGPNRAKIGIDAVVDFTRIERFEAKDGTSTVRGERGVSPFLWSGSSAKDNVPELLPGVPLPADGPSIGAKPVNYVRENTFPSEFVRRLAVTLIVDETVTDEQIDAVRKILSDLLDLKAARGDAVAVTRTAFAPVWRTIWHEPEMVGAIAKYLTITLLTLLTLFVISLCFVRLTTAMGDVARYQSQQLTMDMNRSTELMAGAADAANPEAEVVKQASEEPRQLKADVVFNVRPDQVEALVEMVSGESAENIALIVSHLPPEIRQLLLGKLKGQLAQEVLIHFGRVRFLDSDMLYNLKEEIESRLAGAIGGIESLVKMIEAAPVSERDRLLSGIEDRDPVLAQRLRQRIFVFSDLARMTSEEWSQLNARLRHDDWAAALGGGAWPQVAESLRESLAPEAWRVLQQMLESSAAEPESAQEAQEKISHEALQLMAEGKIGRDLPQRRLPPVASAEGVPGNG